MIFNDRPNYWDAWDVEVHRLETSHPLQFGDITVVAQGPLRTVVHAETKYGKSTLGSRFLLMQLGLRFSLIRDRISTLMLWIGVRGMSF